VKVYLVFGEIESGTARVEQEMNKSERIERVVNIDELKTVIIQIIKCY